MANPVVVYAHPNKKYHDAMLKKVFSFYDSVQEVLGYMGQESVDRECAWIRKALFGTSPVCLVNRSDWRLKHIKQLDRVMQCKPGWNCHSLIYCPDCLANWRYTHAATIREMKKESSDLRLIFRRESFLIPRGVYVSDDGYKKGLLINTHINPVFDLPGGMRNFNGKQSRVVEDYRLREFRTGLDNTTDQYTDLLSDVWKIIGGFNTIETPFQLDYANGLDFDSCKKGQQGRLRRNNLIKHNMQKGISDLAVNPLIPELLSRATQITKKFRNTPGYIHRIIIVPSNINEAVSVLRLDSLFLAPRSIYDQLKAEAKEEENSSWKTDRHYRKIPFKNDPSKVWSVCNKVTTNCRRIPDDMHELLALLENRFPYTGNWFTRFLPQEFPFYMNCFSQYQYHRTGGVFTRRA